MTRTMLIGTAMLSVAFWTAAAGGQQPLGNFAAVDHAAGSPANGSLHVTRQNVFAIPFSVDRRAAQPVEVHLYVSVDQGTSWQLASRQLPTARQFTFRADGDREYWFSSRTLDSNRQAGPVDSLRPELRVIVDTMQPQVEFTAFPTNDGQVTASWRAMDQNLVASSLRVEYQGEVGQPWQPVALTTPREDVVRTSFQGNVTWRPTLESATINVRAEVRDAAGNLTVANRRLLMPVAATRPTASTAGTEPFARNRLASEGALPWPSDNALPAERAPVPDTPASDTPTPFGHFASSNSQANREEAIPADVPTTRTPPGEPQPPVTAIAPLDQPGTSIVTNREPPQEFTQPPQYPTPAVPAETGPPAAADPPPSAAPILAEPSPAEPSPAEPSLAEPDRNATIPPTPSSAAPPVGELPYMTSSTHFQLDYDTEAVGSSGIAEVQLWATADSGQTWRLWGMDDDMQSPFDVAVREEGVFGFRVVIVSRSGMSGRNPRSGDLADIWVGVDTTAPRAKLASATYGSGAQAGQLCIRWDASDSYLGPRPVSLLFAESADGPWTSIASALPNTGEFAWPADPQLPPQIFLRLEVRDEAGNVGVDQQANPIRVDGLAPRARIRGVKPLREADREAFRQPRRG